MFIHATSAYLTAPVGNPQVLKEELKRYTEVHFRRVNKFVMLALIGAHQCVFGRTPGKRSSVYLTTERGNLGDTESVLNQIYRRQSLPMPYNFINTMSNTASFYVSQGLGVAGRNISVSSRNLSFERGLELLRTDLALGVVDSALIGGVDEANLSEAHFQRKFGVPSDAVRQMEGSCWLYLRARPEGAAGEVTDLCSFGAKDAAMTWLMAKTFPSPPVLAFGMAVREEERRIWKRTITHADEFDYIGTYGYFDSATAAAASLFVRDFRDAFLVHINRDFQGHYVMLIIRRYS